MIATPAGGSVTFYRLPARPAGSANDPHGNSRVARQISDLPHRGLSDESPAVSLCPAQTHGRDPPKDIDDRHMTRLSGGAGGPSIQRFDVA